MSQEPRLREETSSTGTPIYMEPPATFQDEQQSHYSQHRSIETLVVVLAVITILAVVAGVLARICGGRRGEHDIEGWVERRCRSCIDAGLPSSAAPPPPPPAAAAEEEAKK